MKFQKKPGIRASELPTVLPKPTPIGHSLVVTAQIYVLALCLCGYNKSLTNIANYFGLKLCTLSRLLSHALLGEQLDIKLNREMRLMIAAFLRKGKAKTIEFIIDATIIERASRKAENTSIYHSNGKKINGHRITNIGMLLDGDMYIPLAFLAHKSRPYARKLGLSYLTEAQMVNKWLRSNMHSFIKLFEKYSIEAKEINFLLDAGYDNFRIQKTIRSFGSHFTMMVKSTRSVGGRKVKEFFRRHRNLKWNTVRLNKKNGEKTKRRKYRIRTAADVCLHKVGKVTVVCSEKACRNKKTRRYLVSSIPNISGREILVKYARRWRIETWHKEMKQSYGFSDCSASSFDSILNHLRLCVLAYLLQLKGLSSLPQKGTKIGVFLQYSSKKEARSILRLINGADEFSKHLKSCEMEVFSTVA